MELPDVPGIGPAYAGRLLAAGIVDAESLANVTDPAALATKSGIPARRLSEAVEAARVAVDRQAEGIAIDVPDLPFAPALQKLALGGEKMKEWVRARVPARGDLVTRFRSGQARSRYGSTRGPS